MSGLLPTSTMSGRGSGVSRFAPRLEAVKAQGEAEGDARGEVAALREAILEVFAARELTVGNDVRSIRRLRGPCSPACIGKRSLLLHRQS
jgi:hypothetical protein